MILQTMIINYVGIIYDFELQRNKMIQHTKTEKMVSMLCLGSFTLLSAIHGTRPGETWQENGSHPGWLNLREPQIQKIFICCFWTFASTSDYWQPVKKAIKLYNNCTVFRGFYTHIQLLKNLLDHRPAWGKCHSCLKLMILVITKIIFQNHHWVIHQYALAL